MKMFILFTLMTLVGLLHSSEAIECYHCQVGDDPFKDENCAEQSQFKMDCSNETMNKDPTLSLAPVPENYTDAGTNFCMTLQFLEQAVNRNPQGKIIRGFGITKTCLPSIHHQCLQSAWGSPLRDGSCIKQHGPTKIIHFLKKHERCVNITANITGSAVASVRSLVIPPEDAMTSASATASGRRVSVNGQQLRTQLKKLEICFCQGSLCNLGVNKEFSSSSASSCHPRGSPSLLIMLYLFLIVIQPEMEDE